MKKTSIRVIGSYCVVLSFAAILSAHDKKAERPEKPARAIAADTVSAGERKFETHCSRCHEAPENIPRSVAGTVLKHMRVRANLSEEDEKLILQYIMP
jgi:hypothetical protein